MPLYLKKNVINRLTKIYRQVDMPMRHHETDGRPIYCLCDISAVLTSHQVSMWASNEYDEEQEHI